MSSANSNIKNLTEGPLVPKIFQFIIPIMTMNLLQNLYNAADMVVVGYSGVEGALGAIGTTAAMNNFFLNIFIGFSIGANIMVSRHVGAGSERATREAVHTAICKTGGLMFHLGFAAGADPDAFHPANDRR